MRKLANPAIQLLNLALALATNFGLPLLLGLSMYGDFVRDVAPTFFIAKLLEAGFDLYVIDTVTKREGGILQIIPNTLLYKCLFGLPMVLLAGAFFPVEHVFATVCMAFGMYFSSLAMASAYALRSRAILLRILIAAVVGLVMVLVTLALLPKSVSVVLWLLVVFNIYHGTIALAFAYRHWFSPAKLEHASFVTYSAFLAFSLPSNFIQTGIVTVASFFQGGRQLGVFRLGVSLIQAATTLFPVNPKRIYFALADRSRTNSEKSHVLPAYLTIAYWMFGSAVVLPWAIEILESGPDWLAGYVKMLPGTPNFWLLVGVGFGLFITMTVVEKAFIAERGINYCSKVSVAVAVPMILVCIFALSLGVRNLVLVYDVCCASYIWLIFIIARNWPKSVWLPVSAFALLYLAAIFTFLQFNEQAQPWTIMVAVICLAVAIGYSLLRGLTRDAINAVTEQVR